MVLPFTAPGIQVYVETPLAVNVAEFPAHIVLEGAATIETVGGLTAKTVIVV